MSNTDPLVWPYYFCTTLIAVLGATAFVLTGLTTLAIAWASTFSVIGILTGLAPSLRRHTGSWLVRSVTAAARPTVWDAIFNVYPALLQRCTRARLLRLRTRALHEIPSRGTRGRAPLAP